MLGYSVNFSAAVLDIADCTGHLEGGGKKYASFIAKLFIPHLTELDPNKNLADCVFFDVVSNVQKAEEILTVKFPGVECLFEAEHCVSFFSDVAKLPPVRKLIK